MTTFGGATVPPLFGGGAPFPSFATSPLVWYDQTHTVTTNVTTQERIRMDNSVSGGLYMVTDINGVFPVAELTPPIQWVIPAPPALDYSFRWVADEGPDALTPEFNSEFLKWVRAAFSPTYRLVNTVDGTTKQNTSVFQIALTSDLTTILAQCRKTMIFTHLPP